MQPRKQHLIDTARTLFNQYGFHATGIDLILAQSKVSKATLYKHFQSKDELILAALAQQHERVMNMMQAKFDDLAESDELQVLMLFDVLDDWFNSDGFFGCNFINASAEYSQAEHPIYEYAAQHKREVVEFISTKLASQQSSKAVQIGLLVEGAIVMAHTHGIKNSALIAKDMAQQVIKGNAE
ncbi:TetR/AcrR family transcriptional regulator [Vibrio sp. MA40-2]|uniref:TetR/AcrR family transcriptional regulator n=1 Tax=Vibrio sp. MA40-2 TaxID=3391828 RepID=UPI0039A5B1AD